MRNDTLKRLSEGVDKPQKGIGSAPLTLIHLKGVCAEVTDGRVLFVEQVSEQDLPNVCIDPKAFASFLSPLSVDNGVIRDAKNTVITPADTADFPDTSAVIDENNKLVTKFKIGIAKATLRKMLNVLPNDDHPIVFDFKDNDKPIEFSDGTTSGLLMPMLIKEVENA